MKQVLSSASMPHAHKLQETNVAMPTWLKTSWIQTRVSAQRYQCVSSLWSMALALSKRPPRGQSTLDVGQLGSPKK